MIVDGRLPAGTRINEVHLAAKLGISRTPLREALIRLVGEGALASQPRSGFYVRPLTLEEFEQIYPIRALLDPEALRLAGVPSPKRLARLEKMNRRLGEASNPETVISLDDAWHRELLADCPNPILIGLIEQFMRRTRRYELALMREHRNVQRTTRDHDKILARLRAGDLDGACAALRRNMESGRRPIIAWLRQRRTK
jgi:DNA-binding GntR family transcriptional regulator